MTGGDYQFLFTEQTIPGRFELELLQGEKTWKVGDGRDEEARQAFRNLLFFTFASILELEVIKTRTADAYEKVFHGRSDIPSYSEKRDRYSSFLYDAVLLYFMALNVTLTTKNSTTGTDIFNTISRPGITFEALTGDVYIDKDGDRLPSFVVWDMGPNDRFRTAITIVYWMSPNGVNTTLEDHAPILWGDGRSRKFYTPPDSPPCGFFNEFCPPDTQHQVVLVSALVSTMLAFAVGALIFYRWWRNERDLNNLKWKVHFPDLDFNFRRHKRKATLGSRQGDTHLDRDSVRSDGSDAGEMMASSEHPSVESGLDGSVTFYQYTTIAKYKENIVAVKKIWKQRIQTDRKLMKHIKEMMMLKHSNLTTFVGICAESPNICILWEYCNKGSLSDILDNPDMKLDSMFQFSIAIDICSGLEYLHMSSLKYHGNLTSSNCLIDSRWVCKLTDFGLRPIRKGEKDTSDQVSEDDRCEKLFWLAPELLRTYQAEKRFTPTQQGDVYAVGVILKEILCLTKPYAEEVRLTPKDIIKRVAHPTDHLMRPTVVETQDEYVSLRLPFVRLIHSCWAEDPQCRPTIRRVLKRLNRLNPYRSTGMLDNMLMMMERYSNHLEELVADRTARLEEEKRKTDALLYSMLPQKVADNLKTGNLVQAEAFESVTIYFSDVVSFTDLASESTPMEIIELLNTLYTLFDDTIKNFDVYKVETIGDAYMMASGVPIQNGDQHVMEMADASLSLLKAVLGYVIPHRPERQLKIRIGIHTGPIVAGVVGQTMPRYCLFGDTVNTASRMESNGMPLKIHMSGSSAALLKTNPLYHVVERGNVEIKGKGRLCTFWLMGKTGFFKVPTEDLDSHNTSVASGLKEPETVYHGDVTPSITSATTPDTTSAGASTVDDDRGASNVPHDDMT
ncbi:atrial natriuretic peptide receptor 1-like [Haliotis asinina]|uniref:atrial natriuretic peptide receptor 1-like n=1 Tax=Haliotis asinina TaxID=109174 RepID=UPI003531DF28